MDMKDKVNELGRKRASTLDSERPHAVDRQKALGKLTARQRLELLCDPGSFLEFGQLAEASNIKDRESPADGVILGVGLWYGVLWSVGPMFASWFGLPAGAVIAMALGVLLGLGVVCGSICMLLLWGPR